MAAVLVFARLGSPAVADVRAVLRDWATAGLLTAPIWIDVAQDDDPRRSVTGWESGPGGEWAVNVNSWFTAQGMAASGAGIRLICLQPLSGPGDVVPIAPVALLRERLGLPALQVLNVLAPAPGLTGLPDDALFDSQRNVLVQPVDTEDPAGKGFTVPLGSPAAMHAAAGLATVAGLWSAMGEAPNDRDHPWAGRQLQVARCYLRYLDGSEVLDGIAEAVLDENGGRPSSRTAQGQVFPTVNPDMRVPTAETAAQMLVASQPVASYSPLPPPPVPAKKQVRPGAALADFFSFLGGALVRAPGEWVTRKIEGFQAGVSSKLTSALYGQDGAYEVVMGNRAGRPPDAAAASDGARWLVSRLSPGSEAPSPDAHALWRGEVTAAVALVDGSATSVTEMPSRGTQRLLIGDPAAVAPARSTPPFRVPAGLLRSQVPVTIAPNDPYTARRVLEELTGIQQATSSWGGSWGAAGWGNESSFNPGGPSGQNQGAQAGLIAGQLRQWMAQQRSFTWAVSDRIAAGMIAAQADQAQLLGAATAQEIKSAQASAQQEAGKTKKRLLGWVIGLLVAVAVIVALAIAKLLNGWLLALIVLVLLLVWLGGALATFISSSKRYYQLIYALDVLAARRGWADSHSLVVPQSIIRLADVYRRSRQWGDVISDLVHDPFCRDSRSAERGTGPVRLSGTLPFGMALGHLPFDPESYRNEIFRAAAITLQPGWLDTTETSRRALALSVRSRQSGVREHEMVWNSDGTENSGLAALVAAMGAPEFRRTNAQGAVGWLNGKLQSGGFDLKQAQIDAGGSLRTVHASEFVQQLVEATPVPHQEGMSAAGIQSGAADVATTHFWGVPGRSTEIHDPSSGLAGSSVRRVVLHPAAPTSPTVLGGNPSRRLLDRLVVRCDMTRGLSTGELSYFQTSTVTNEDDSPAWTAPATPLGGPAESVGAAGPGWPDSHGQSGDEPPPPVFKSRA